MWGVWEVCILGTERLVAMEVRADAGIGSMDFLRRSGGGSINRRTLGGQSAAVPVLNS